MKRNRYDRPNNRFAEVPAPTLNRSLFNRNFGNKFTFNEGYLVPVHVDEIYGGDTIQIDASAFVRLTTPITPIMDNIDFDLHAFFVPSRILWKNYYRMLGAQDNPGDSTDYTVPIIYAQTQSIPSVFPSGSLADYFGLPVNVTIPNPDLPISLPFRAYNKIYNDWYRDENLQNSAYFSDGDTPDVSLNYPLRRRNKKHDYFTSCLPFAQKGEAVNLPLGGFVPVVPVDGAPSDITLENTVLTDGTDDYSINVEQDISSPLETYSPQTSIGVPSGGLGKTNLNVKVNSNFIENFGVDLSSADAVTINELRQAIAVQHILERNARSGTRDVELLKAKYGVSPTDERLQRSELIGSSRARLNLTTIAQVSSSTEQSPLGELSAVGTIRAGIKVDYSARENGFIIILASCRAEITYQQGMRRMWSKKNSLDILDPMLCNIGEQPVLRKEICLVDNTEYNNEVFGYLPNYDDLRFGSNIITGDFRSSAPTSLDIWHLAEEFDVDNPPVLSSEFIQQNSPLERCLAVNDAPHFFGDFYAKCKHARVIPIHSVPGLRRL